MLVSKRQSRTRLVNVIADIHKQGIDILFVGEAINES